VTVSWLTDTGTLVHGFCGTSRPLRWFKDVMGSVVSAEGPVGRRGGSSSGKDQQTRTGSGASDARGEHYSPTTSRTNDGFKPASVYATVVKNSPKLIGWDDAKFQRLAREAYEEGQRERRQQQRGEDSNIGTPIENDDGSMTLSEEEEAFALKRLGPDESERHILNEIGYGVFAIAAETVTEYLLKGERNDESPAVPEKKTDTTEAPKDIDSDNAEYVSSESNEFYEQNDTAVEGSAGKSGGTMRDTELYKFTLNALRWQRDAYLVGTAYADSRKKQRKLEESNSQDAGLSSSVTGTGMVPEMSTAMIQTQIVDAHKQNTRMRNPSLGQTQLVQLGKWFIPSDTSKGALLPTVLWLPGPNGPLDRPFSRAVTSIIPMSQANLDSVMKNNILWVLKNEAWRNHAKFGASGYVTEMQRDTSE